jgi:transposase
MNSQTYKHQRKYGSTVLRHAEEISVNVAGAYRYYSISKSTFYKWERRIKTEGPDGLRERCRASKNSPNATHF